MKQPCRYRAHAKINLGLEVGGLRPDGYHEMRSVLQSIALCDILDFSPAEEGIRVTCSDPSLGTGEDNLVIRAAKALLGAFNCERGARIHLNKIIPMEAGLGGGSSDAAVTLLALAKLWKLEASREDLLELALGLGSDVPYFLVGGTVLAVGRGEEVYPLPDAPPLHVLIVPTASGMSTKRAYSLIDKRLTECPAVPKIFTTVQGVVEGKLSEGVLFNHFEEVYGQIEGEVAVLRRILLKNGTGRLLLAGSGSAWLGIFTSREEAREARRSLALAGSKGILTQTLTRKDYWDLTVPSVEKENRQ